MDGDERDGAAEPPRFLKNVTAWIGGLTGVVIALAGLRAAYNQFMPDQRAGTEVAALSNEAQAGSEASNDTAAEDSEAAPESSTLPLAYSGGGYQIEWKDGEWVETDSDGKVARYEQQSRDATDTFVIDRANNVRWRWPTEGGAVQSFDQDKQEWVDSEIVYSPVTEEVS